VRVKEEPLGIKTTSVFLSGAGKERKRLARVEALLLCECSERSVWTQLCEAEAMKRRKKQQPKY
jgi:hypothetical protein